MVEEGEISRVNLNYSSSGNNSNGQKNQNSSRVWTMRDLYKYNPISRDYANRGLYNMAWAQAVQNKPLDELFYKATGNDQITNPNPSSNSNSNSNSDSKEVLVNAENGEGSVEASGSANMGETDVSDDAKEEGELEEGEIDMDSDFVDVRMDDKKGDEDVGADGDDAVKSEVEVEQLVNAVQEGLEGITGDDAEKSFHEFCSRLESSLDSLQKLMLKNSMTDKDTIVQIFFAAIQIVNSVFSSWDDNLKEQHGTIFSRLVDHVINQKAIFSPEQLMDIKEMVSSVNFSTAPLVIQDGHSAREVKDICKNDLDASTTNGDQDSACQKKYDLDSVSSESLDQKEHHMSLDYLRSRKSSFKQRGLSLPMLDLYKNHDVDSLPSPTRETPQALPVAKTSLIELRTGNLELPMPGRVNLNGNLVVHSYETDALNAVSTYQQKFGRSSFIIDDRLPSPTPSGEGDNGHGDVGGEVSSASVVQTVNRPNLVNPPPVRKPSSFSVPKPDVVSGRGISNVMNGSLNVVSTAGVRTSSLNSRDPRLRLANYDMAGCGAKQPLLAAGSFESKAEPLRGMMSLGKQKNLDEPAVDGPELKKRRSELTDPRKRQSQSATGGWLEDRGTVGMQITKEKHVQENTGSSLKQLVHALTSTSASPIMPSVSTSGNENEPITGNSATSSLHSLLKDIVVNPSMLMNIFKMEQQKSMDSLRTTAAAAPISISVQGAIPSLKSTTPNPSMLGQRSAAVPLPAQQTSLTDKKVRMKPRDPRRVLHDNMSPKVVMMSSNESKSSTLNPQENVGNLSTHDRGHQLDVKSIASQPIMQPDIAKQKITNNLEDLADKISVSQSSMSQPGAPQIPPPKTTVAEPSTQESGIGSVSKEADARSSHLPSAWGDVELLFEGFDDQQKAAIQRERTRRIEEQQKMFASRKLCLVLDLDHTLLNSAKFIEVDPVHEEILRKKEDQDREKPHRHLFRFPHMGMWTKLRPGIWNFLEKASKFYELHLSTMGNKRYATEMAKLLDPKGNLFAGRVISRGDDGDPLDVDDKIPKSKDLEGVLGMESAVVIMDDSVRVWPHNKMNLIVVERYIYFPCSRRQFGLPGPSLLEIDHDERPEDGTLAASLAVIERIHQNFFAHRSLDEADVRNILAVEQRKILAGCRIVFSRVFPVGEAHPHLHPLWQTAEQFGAVCTNQIDEHVTHVVALSLGTDKVNWALSTGRFVVHPGWVEASALLYRRANEHDFAIKS